MLSLLLAAAASAVPLDVVSERLEVDLSGIVSVDSQEAEGFAITGPWRLVRTIDGVRTWEAPLPARTRTLFFHRPPPGMTMHAGALEEAESKLTHAPIGHSRAHTWTFDSHSVRVRRPVAAGPPPSNDYKMRFSTASQRERSLRQPDGDPTGFVVRSLQIDDTTRRGLYLVPGATVRVSVEIPKDGRLRMAAIGVPPEGADPAVPRNGQSVVLTAIVDDVVFPLTSVRPPDGHPTPVDVDLDRFAGQTITLGFAAPLDGTDSHDAVLLASPSVLVPKAKPERVVLVIIDTLRHDALSLAGNSNATSPGLDAWAEQAAVFTQARSVAPWTLPSVRTMFSGHLPELWGRRESLPQLLHAAGWSTAFIAGNIYLSSNFAMAGDWGTHRCINWPQAEVQVNRARAWLHDNRDQSAFLVLHFMDMHLPYTEPPEFRERFAGPTPEPFTGDVFHRNQILKWERKMGDSGKAWLRGRYDNNLAYIDSVLTPFLNELPLDATVLVLSDHGEEFWDHGEFEHGHSLYDELLRVPLLAKGPGLSAGSHDLPTSLMDVAPTVLQAAGLDVDLDGIPLQVLSTAPPPEAAERPIAFGRPLYGRRRWGVVQGNLKYTTHKSIEKIVNFVEDPDEKRNLVLRGHSTAPWREALSNGLGLPVEVAYAIYPQRSTTKADTLVRVELAEGIKAAWAAEDPTEQSAVTVDLDDTVATLIWQGGERGTREAYVLPDGDIFAALGQTSILIGTKQARTPLPLASSDEAEALHSRHLTLGRARADGRSVSVNFAVVPLPPEHSVGIAGYDAEVSSELEALGYLEP